jgi:hypothetical protein
MANGKEEKEGGAEWMQKLWRPAMGWMYMLICLADMIVFPVLWSLLQAVTHSPITQWNPLTLQGAGLFHIAMGAVLGISAFGRTQEKLAGTAANPTATSTTSTTNTNNMGGGNGNTGGFGGGSAFGAPQAGGFGSSGGFGASAPAATGGFGTPGGFGATTPGASAGGFGGGGVGSTPPATTASGKKIVPDDPSAFPLQ